MRVLANLQQRTLSVSFADSSPSRGSQVRCSVYPGLHRPLPLPLGEVPTKWAERVGQWNRCERLEICCNAPSQSASLTAPPQGGAKLGAAVIQDCTDPCLSLWENRVMDVYITSLCPHHTAAMTAALAALSAARICSRVGSAIKGTVSMAWRTSRGMS